MRTSISRGRTACPARRAPMRRGMALLEVLVALVLIATAGTAVVALVAQAEASVRRACEAERRIGRAHAFFQAATLWSAAELDLRLGTRAQGPYRLRILRPTPTLYVLTLTDSVTPDRPLLQTAVYRPADSTVVGAPATATAGPPVAPVTPALGAPARAP